jgi:hypothetical protein
MLTNNMIMLSTLYIVLAMVLVSLDGTYNLTYNVLKIFGFKTKQEKYGIGMKLNQTGFLLHIVVFAVLVAVPMVLCKNKN